MKSDLLDKIRTFLDSHPIEKAWLFGSYSRGEEKDSSDIDILIRFQDNQSPSLLKFSAMINELQDILHIPVDLVKEGTVYPEILPHIEQEKILIYERRS